MLKKSLLAAVLLASASMFAPASAQDANSRIDMLEEQIRMLTGKVEELNFSVKQLQGQLRKSNATSTAPEAAPAPAAPKKKVVISSSDGEETIEQVPLAPAKKTQAATAEEPSIYGDGTQDLAAGGNAAAQPGDGGFEGQVIEDGTQVAANPAVTADEDANTVANPNDVISDDAGGVEQVSLQQDTPESLYKRSDEALLRRQFPEAEKGFKDFLSKYPEHSLAGSAQYWLGETFYVQGNYRTAAQNFLAGYQKFPKSRRAPDSLLKLGLSLNKLGQKSQACAALGNVAGEFPKAVEAKKRAATEFKRAGC
jgi:tol-pal system protein YbgF